MSQHGKYASCDRCSSRENQVCCVKAPLQLFDPLQQLSLLISPFTGSAQLISPCAAEVLHCDDAASSLVSMDSLSCTMGYRQVHVDVACALAAPLTVHFTLG